MTDETRLRDPVHEAARHWEERYPDTRGFASMVSLIRAYSVAVRAIEAVLKPHGLNLSRYEVLLLLSFTRAGCLPTMRLRDLLMVHGSSVTYLVDKLQEAGLVRRDADPADGRVSLVAITDAGRDLVDDASRAVGAAGFAPFAGLDDRASEELVSILGHVRAAIPRPSAGGEDDAAGR